MEASFPFTLTNLKTELGEVREEGVMVTISNGLMMWVIFVSNSTLETICSRAFGAPTQPTKDIGRCPIRCAGQLAISQQASI